MTLLKKTIPFFAVSSLIALEACSNEDYLTSGSAGDAFLSVNISRDDFSDTRAILDEENGNLVNKWEVTDKILVTDAQGNFAGILDIDPDDAGKSNASFSGPIANVKNGNSYSFNFLYTGRNKEDKNLKNLSSPLVVDFSSQNGTFESLYENDLFSATKEVTIVNGRGDINSLSLERKTAFGHFEVQPSAMAS